MDLNSLPGSELFAIWSALQHRQIQLMQKIATASSQVLMDLNIEMLHKIDVLIASKRTDELQSEGRATVIEDIKRSSAHIARLTALVYQR